MKMNSLSIKNVIRTFPNDKISKVLSEMISNKIHQVPVVDGEIYQGMIFLKDVVMEDTDPSTANARNYMKKNLPRLSLSSSIHDAASLMINSSVRALPVLNGEKLVGIFSETDLLEHVPKDSVASDIMASPFIIAESDTIGKAKQMMREHNVSRLPVINEKGDLVGVIDTLDLARSMKPPEKQDLSRGKAGPGESFHSSKIQISSFMHVPEMMNTEASLENIISALQKSEEVMITEGKKPLGIITPKDIVELLISKNSSSPIQISGIDHGDEISMNSVKEPLEKWIKKSGSDVDYLFVYVHRGNIGGRVRYSLHMRMRTKLGFFVAKSDGWDLLSCSQELAKKAYSLTEKKHGLDIDKKKRRGKFGRK